MFILTTSLQAPKSPEHRNHSKDTDITYSLRLRTSRSPIAQTTSVLDRRRRPRIPSKTNNDNQQASNLDEDAFTACYGGLASSRRERGRPTRGAPGERTT